MRASNHFQFVALTAVILAVRGVAPCQEARDLFSITDEKGGGTSSIAWDIGSVKAGEKPRRSFSIENMLGVTCVPSRQTTSCRCLSIVERVGDIAPRGSGSFTLELDTTGLRGKRTFRSFCVVEGPPSECILTVPVSVDVARNADGPVFELPERTCDFGVVKKASKYNRVVTVCNSGSAMLELISARATCGGCVDVTTGGRSIPPGGQTDLTITLDTSGQRGRIKQTLYLETNDPNEPIVEVEILATVACAWCEVRTLDFGGVSGEGEVKRAAFLLISGYPSGAVTKATCESPEVRVVATPCQMDADATRTADKAFVVEVFLNPKDLMPGPFATNVLVETNVPGSDKLVIGVMAHAVGIVSVRPTSVFFGAAGFGESIERECDIRMPEALAGTLNELQLTCDRPELSASLAGVAADGNSGRVRIVLRAEKGKTEPGFISGQVRGLIKDKCVVNIPYAGVVKDNS